jgi:flagellar hook-associated protein 1 FlgK
MSLSQALATAVSGLHAAQTGLSVVAANVANAETPGYVRKTAVQLSTTTGGFGVGVRTAAINRELDKYLQRQLRVETSGASYADLRARFYDRLQGVYGVPGADSSLETGFNNFMTALQALSTSPDQLSARSAVLSSAQVLTQQLNSMTADIQGLRSDAELGLADAVAKANEAMRRIADINRQLGTATSNDAAAATLLDQRDVYIDQLAQLMDINVISGDHNQVTVFTNSGIQLVGTNASTLAFDAQGAMTATAQWSADPSQRAAGTIVLKGPNGGDVDLIAGNSIRSGQIAAYLEMRDQILVEAQNQLDEIAGGLARALSDRTVAGTAVTSGAQSGFDIDLGPLLAGNSVRLTYTDNTSSTQRTLTLMRVDDPAALPLADTATADPTDKVLGLDFSGGMSSILSQLATAFGTTNLQFSNPSGTTLRVLDDGAMNKVDVDAVSATVTTTSLTAGTAELPFFLDASGSYTGAITTLGSQSVGFAGRIAVNANLLADPSRLVVYQTSPLTPAADATRPNFIYDRLNGASLTFSPGSGVGTAPAPFTGSLPSFMRQVISQQGEAAEAAASLKQGQDVVVNSLQQRFNDGASVNIDQEMANLLNLQNAYAANARVLSTVKDMLDILMRM